MNEAHSAAPAMAGFASGKSCATCRQPVAKSNKSGRCGPCAHKDPAVRARKGKLSPEQRARRAEQARKLSADPAVVARRAASGKVTLALPSVKARHRAGVKAGRARHLADPAALAKLSARARVAGRQNIHCANTPEARAKAAANLQRSRLAWCPERYWPLNFELRRAGYRLAERKQMVADQIAIDEREARAAETPFERQMAQVAAGAQIIAKFTPRKADPDFTLGGVSGGML